MWAGSRMSFRTACFAVLARYEPLMKCNGSAGASPNLKFVATSRDLAGRLLRHGRAGSSLPNEDCHTLLFLIDRSVLERISILNPNRNHEPVWMRGTQIAERGSTCEQLRPDASLKDAASLGPMAASIPGRPFSVGHRRSPLTLEGHRALSPFGSSIPT